MREGGQPTGHVARGTSLLVLAGALLLGGCAGLLRSYDIAPSGLTRIEDGFRQRLVQGRADSAFVADLLHGETAPGDELLRALYGGVAAYYAGRYRESAALLDRAALLSEERATKSISRSALSLLSNDRALPYEPPRTERLLIPYYAALAYLRLPDRTGAAVEARRLSALLEQYEHDVADDEAGLHAALRVFAGAVFQAAGERNDAAVAFRQAGGFAGVDSVLRLPPRDSADVLVFIETGFVAHRVEEGLMVLLAPEEIHALREGSADDRLGIATLISDRVVATASTQPRRWDGPRSRNGGLFVGAPAHPVVARHDHERCTEPAIAIGDPPGTTTRAGDSTRVQTVRTGLTTTRTTTTRTTTVTSPDGTRTTTSTDPDGKTTTTVAAPDGKTTVSTTNVQPATNTLSRRGCVEDDDDVPYLLRVAWPAYRRTSGVPFGGTVTAAAGDTVPNARFADVSSAVLRDFQRELPLVVARTIARGALKAALTRAAERKAEEKDEVLGQIVGALGNAGNVLLERADTRSWHLLPGAIGVARLRLPAGDQVLRVQLADGRVLDLGALTLAARETRVVTARAW